MMWLKIKKMFLKIMVTCLALLLSSTSSKDQLVASQYMKTFYDVVYCSFNSILFLAAIKIVNERYDTVILNIFYLIGYFAWAMYLFTGTTYLISAIIEKYTKINLESVMTRLIYNSLAFIFSSGFAILGPKIIVDFVNMNFSIN